jgi:hypothetical protein
LTESRRFECIEYIQSFGFDVNFAEGVAQDRQFNARCSISAADKPASKEALPETAEQMLHNLLASLKQ